MSIISILSVLTVCDDQIIVLYSISKVAGLLHEYLTHQPKWAVPE